MLYQAHLPYTLWVEALYTASFLSNLLPSSVNNKLVSPFELLNGQPPVYTSLRVFGCACYPYLRPYSKHKFDPKSLLCVFVGYNEKYKGYRCYHPPTGRVYINRHVLFDEDRLPYTDSYKHLLPSPTTPLSSAWRLQYQLSRPVSSDEEISAVMEEVGRVVKVPLHQMTQAQEVSEVVQQQASLGDSAENTGNSDNGSNQEDGVDQVLVPVAENTHQMTTRRKAGVSKPNPRYALLTVKGLPQQPNTLQEALSHPGWNGSMVEEIDTCHETKTWSVVPLPPGVKPIRSRWVHKVKLNADGTFQKFRSRVVAKGNEQKEGVDFLETYSPVVRTATVRIVLHLAVVERWEIRQLDVKNAFLHGDLTETVYMRQPPGFEDKEHPDYVCHLHKAIYGLKQAPRAWFDKFSSYLLEFGFTCNVKDPSLFVYQKGKDVIMLLLYVDDMVLTGNNKTLLQHLLDSLKKQFRMKDMGPLSYFLGIQAHFTPTGLFLNQEKYGTDLLQAAGMLDCSPMPTPLPLQLDRVPHQDEVFSNPTYFRSLAGKLQYLTLTRPDIQFAVNLVCQKMHEPTVSDFHLLKRILRYLKGSIQMGLYLESDSDSQLRAYCDSDWAGCQDTRRSTGGFCTFLGSNLISWSAKRQDSVARSSTEAEYRTLSDTAAELEWISGMLKTLGINQRIVAEVYCDNLSAVHLTANPVLHRKSKHFATHYHFAREKVADGSLVVKHIAALHQLADVFTKSLPQQNYTRLRSKLGVAYPPTSSLSGSIKPNGSASNKTLGLASDKPTAAITTVKNTAKQNKGKQQEKSTVPPAHEIILRNRFDSLLGHDE